MRPAQNINGGDSTFWMECSNPRCTTFVNTYLPQDYQKDIHTTMHKYIGVFGGYGSGKTQCSLEDDEKHMLTNPNGMTVVGSAVLSQVEDTYEKDFRNDFPSAFVANENKTKKIYTLINGHQLFIKSFYDEELLRSMNATRIHIVEASAVDHEIFVQLQARLRNLVATKQAVDPDTKQPIFDLKTNSFKFEADWRRCIIESNPSVGWIRDQYLMQSGYINTDYCEQQYTVSNPNPNFSSFIFPTKLNKFLPTGFEQDLARNKPLWWVNRYLNGSFDYAEGMVYPNVMKCMTNSFEVPDNWPRYMAMDYGINDPTAFVFLALDKANRCLYVIGETYYNNRNYKEQAAIYWQAHKIYVPQNNFWKRPVMDGRSINKRNDSNLKTIGDLFKEEGILFNPAKMELDARMLQLNTLIDQGHIFIFKDKCPNLYNEIINYKFPERTADGKSRGDKPVDKNNHAVNALEFAVMEFPQDMNVKDLNAYSGDGTVLIPQKYMQMERKIPASEIKRARNPYAFDPFSDDREQKPHQSTGYGKIFESGGIESW